MEKRQFDVTALGELLIDFTENGFSSQGNPLMEANPGGAPCNVLAMLERLGKKTAFIGKVGKDMFGNQLKSAVEEVGIDTRNLILDEKYHTTLAFVHTYPDGDRDFSFYRDPGADMMLTKDEVQKELIESSRIFHFGTLSSTNLPKKPDVSLPLTLTCVHLSGNPWMMPELRLNTACPNVMFSKSPIMK